MLGPENANVGVYGVDGNAVGFDDSALGRHVLFLGGIGTGKTVGMSALIRSLRSVATDNDAFVFFDTKGDYLEAFYQDGDAVITADEDSALPGARTWNVFRDIERSANPDQDVIETASALFASTQEDAGDQNAMWPKMAADLFSALVRALIRSPGEYSHRDIRRIADSMTLQEYHDLIGPHEDLRGVLQYVAKEGSNTTVSVQIFLQQMIRSTFKSAFATEGDFSVRKFLAQKGARAMFLEYDVSSGETLGPVYRTMLDIALKESLGRKSADGRVFMILDEFALLPKMTMLDAGLNFGRSLGMRFIVGTQNVGQIRAAYGEAGGDSILSGFGTVFAFRLFDQPSREFVRNRFGANRRILRYDAALKSRGVVEERIDGSVIEDWDLTGLGVGQSIVSLPDGPPHHFQFAAPTS